LALNVANKQIKQQQQQKIEKVNFSDALAAFVFLELLLNLLLSCSPLFQLVLVLVLVLVIFVFVVCLFAA